MVTVFLQGGLGNQMFQYAVGLHLAKKQNSEPLLDTTLLEDRFSQRKFTRRSFSLDVFTLEPRFTLLSHIASAVPVPGLWFNLDRIYMQLAEAAGARNIIRERSQEFDPSVLNAKGNIALKYGYWQSERYFSAIAEDIRRAFTFKHPFNDEAKELARKIESTNSVSLHVRRGDYLVPNNLLQPLDLQYYKRAVAYIAEHTKDPEFFVFSDDIDWCVANLSLPFPATYVTNSTAGPRASHHMQLMSLCRHNVIANSSFSWWGAWLNRNPGKIVVTPKRWFPNGSSGANDLIPLGWVQI